MRRSSRIRLLAALVAVLYLTAPVWAAFLEAMAPDDTVLNPSTTGDITSDAGSLVVTGCASWTVTGTQTNAETSSLAGTYTEAFESAVDTNVTYSMNYNIGGTRGATHNVTCTATLGGTSINTSATGAEWDNIDATPVVDVGTASTGTGTAASCSVTESSASTATVIGLMVYDENSSTIAVASGTNQATEADENNDNQSQSMGYKTAQSGAVTLNWTIGTSSPWGARCLAFEETGGAAAVVPKLPLLGVGP